MLKICCILIALQIFSLLVLYALTPKENTLRLVHILFRHGERSPSQSYVNDPHKNHKWPGGWDQLTLRGKVEEYQLGLEMRKMYADFLPKVYDPADVLVQSSYADRCIMSAQLLLAGLYPPVAGQIWNEKIPWQPIPVHSIPRFIDNKIAIKKACPLFSKLLQSAYDSAKMREIDANNSDLYDYLSRHTGNEIRNVRTLETLYNTLEIEALNGLPLPEWTAEVFPARMRDLAALSLALFTDTEQMKRLHGGILVKEIVDHLVHEQAGTLKPNRKMLLYSGHDLTVVSLLRVLGFSRLVKPEFAAAIIIELHQVKEKFIVKFLYKPRPGGAAEELVLPECFGSCDLNTLRRLLERVIPENWEEECAS